MSIVHGISGIGMYWIGSGISTTPRHCTLGSVHPRFAHIDNVAVVMFIRLRNTNHIHTPAVR